MNALIIFIVPFIQLGLSYYASIATLFMVLVVCRYFREILVGFAISPWIFLVFAGMFIPAFTYSAGDLVDNLLRAGREAVFLVILVGAVRGIEAKRATAKLAVPIRAILTVLICWFGLELIQAVALATGHYVGFPVSYYIMGSGTIADDNSLRYSMGNLRPSATFSEPSYYGAVLIAFSMMLIYYPHKRYRMLGLVVIVLSGLISRSLAFLVFGLVVMVAPELMPGRFRAKYALAITTVGILGVPALFMTTAGSTFGRLVSVVTSPNSDQSTNTRLSDPLSTLPGYLSDFPIGLPAARVFDVAQKYYHGTGKLSFDNALLNFFFMYGFFAVLIIFTVVLSSRDFRVRLFLFSCMFFNGSYLRLDLVPLMIIAVAYYTGGLKLHRYNPRSFRMQKNEFSEGGMEQSPKSNLKSFSSIAKQ